MNFTTAALITPTLLALMQAVLVKVAPKLEAEIEKYLPAAEDIIAVLTKQADAAAIQAEIISLQEDAIDRVVAAQIDASKT